jgi:hypothetical protein
MASWLPARTSMRASASELPEPVVGCAECWAGGTRRVHLRRCRTLPTCRPLRQLAELMFRLRAS